MATFVYFPITSEVRQNLILNLVFLLLSIIVVAARTAARLQSCLQLWWDDWLVLAAMPFTIGVIIIQGLVSFTGTGHPQSETQVNLLLFRPLQLAFKSLYLAALTCAKTSILCFYLRIFIAHHSIRVCSKYALGLVVAWGVAFWVARMCICTPLFDVGRVCGNEIAMIQSMNVTNILTDLVIVLIPQRHLCVLTGLRGGVSLALWKLRLPLREKIGLISCFLVGIACIVTATFRIIFVANIDITNETGTQVATVFLTSLEPCLAVTCASMPLCRRFLNLRRSTPVWRLRSCRRHRPPGDDEEDSMPQDSSLYTAASSAQIRRDDAVTQTDTRETVAGCIARPGSETV